MATRSLIGQTVGKYQIVETLGRGGMAEVYKAYQASLDRYVAIKVMHSFLADEEGFLTRFQREARAMASLNHSHIVGVYDFDVQDGMYYIVMKFVSGGTLKERLTNLANSGEQMPLEESVRLIMEVADALAYAHARGMVHRDIKPGNIMLDEQGHAVLTDFGIAKILSGPNVTATGAMIGTPAYMSPEQGLGQPGDERSDLYSLGVLFYQMATGRLPYDADTPLAVILKHVNEPIPQPVQFNSDIPPEIQAVIARSMAKDPSERYQSAVEMIQDLQAAAASSNLDLTAGIVLSSVLEHPTPPPYHPEAAETRYSPPQATVLSKTKTPPPEATQIATPSNAISDTEIAKPIMPPAEKKKRPWAIFAVIGILVIVALAIGGFLVFGGGLGSATPTPTQSAVADIEPTDTPTESPTEEALPTADNVSTAVALIAATLTAQPTQTARPSATPTSTSTMTPNATATFLAGCVSDLELVSFYTFQNERSNSTPIGINFTANWVLKNTGTCPLPEGLVFKFEDGDQFGQPEPIVLEKIVHSDEEVTLSGNLLAPNNPGRYRSTWQLENEAGEKIGQPISFEVNAFEPATSTPVATNTPESTPTSSVIEPFGYQLSASSCVYKDSDWQCQLNITPYGGVGPYRVEISDASPPSQYEGAGPFTHPIVSRRCSAWVNTITVIDQGTGQTLSEAKYYDPNALFEGGCVAPP